jgi:hypothetical protein
LAGIERLGLLDEKDMQPFVNVLTNEMLWYRSAVRN